MAKKIYFTITGMRFYYGDAFIRKGMKVKLVKDPKNEYDSECINVKIPGLGKIGNVANSPHTVLGESYSAGRLYDKIGKKAVGKVVMKIDGRGVICELKESKDPEDPKDEKVDVDAEE